MPASAGTEPVARPDRSRREGIRPLVMASRNVIRSIEAEFTRYKELAEGAIAQVDEAALSKVSAGFNNSIAILVWHLSGNLKSRFFDFLSSDGEKPWRDRDEEFVA